MFFFFLRITAQSFPKIELSFLDSLYGSSQIAVRLKTKQLIRKWAEAKERRKIGEEEEQDEDEEYFSLIMWRNKSEERRDERREIDKWCSKMKEREENKH